MKKIVIVMGIIIIILLAILLFIPSNKPSEDDAEVLSDEELAVQKSQEIYQQMKNEGLSMENGPCLSEEIIPDWVLDIAHDPRQEIDNQPENQCQSFREGKTHHFIELDPQGNLLRAL